MFKRIKNIDLNDVYNCIPEEYKVNSELEDLTEITEKGKEKAKRKLFYKFKLGENECIHLTLGHNLLEVFKKSKVAYNLMPNYVCKPIFYSIHEKFELFGQEFFNGMPIDICYERSTINNDDVNKLITKIKNKLNSLKELSSELNLLNEFDELINSIKKVYEIKNEDILIIKKDFRKLLKEHCKNNQKIYKRWSPGDLAARNILVNSEYNFKLIDLEFSSFTHFFDEDWIRLFHFSLSNFKNIESILPVKNDWSSLIWIYHYFKQIYLYSFVVNEKSLINHIQNDLITVFQKLRNLVNSESIILNSFNSHIDTVNDTSAHIESSLRNELMKFSSKCEIAYNDLKHKNNLLNTLNNEKEVLCRNVADLNLKVEFLSSKKSRLENNLLEISSSYKDLFFEYNNLEHDYQIILNENQNKDDKITRLMNSISWKITSPLRFLRRIFIDKKLKILKPGISICYADWVKKYDTIGDREINAQKVLSFGFRTKPLFSILLPVYKSNLKFLSEAIDSVISQTYPNWELCIADDNSDSCEIKKMLEEYARNDDRIKFLLRKNTGHISTCLNSCSELSTGDYITVLDHDDIMCSHALFNVTEVINNHNNAVFIYSDEDKVTESGDRFAPFFKPAWSPDLLMSQNYICHMAFIKSSLFNEIGGFRNGFEGSQDWDLYLRITENLNDKQIFHIPRILYHWRSHDGSTAKNSSSKEYAMDSARCVLNESYKRRGIPASAVPLDNGYFKSSYETTPPSVSIIIPTHNGGHSLEKCLISVIEKTVYKEYEIVIIDNRSDEKTTLNILDKFDKKNDLVRVVKDERPFNFSALNNHAVSKISTEVIVFLNDDTQVLTPDWLYELSVNAIRQDIGAVGAKLLYPNDTIQHAGVILGIGGVAGHAFKNLPDTYNGQLNRANIPHNVSAVTGACLAVERKKFQKVSGFDQKNLSVAFNDVDLCLKLISKGFRNLYLPQVVLYHYESLTRGAENTESKKKRFQKEVEFMTKKWNKMLQNDMYFNPNFSLFSEQFELSEPPRI